MVICFHSLLFLPNDIGFLQSLECSVKLSHFNVDLAYLQENIANLVTQRTNKLPSDIQRFCEMVKCTVYNIQLLVENRHTVVAVSSAKTNSPQVFFSHIQTFEITSQTLFVFLLFEIVDSDLEVSICDFEAIFKIEVFQIAHIFSINLLAKLMHS